MSRQNPLQPSIELFTSCVPQAPPCFETINQLNSSDEMESITVGTFEAKTHLSKLLDALGAGKRVVIPRHGKPAAELVVQAASSGCPRVRAVLALVLCRPKCGVSSERPEELHVPRPRKL